MSRPEFEISTDWTGHAKPGHWYGRYYADWEAALKRNLTTAVNTTREALQHMVSRRDGRVVMVSSLSGPVMAYPNDAGYHAETVVSTP